MASQFDQIVDRKGTSSIKWDKYAERDIIPMWVADMDFQAPPAVRNALADRIEHGVFGYSVPSDSLKDAIVEYCYRRYEWPVRKEWIIWLPALVPALHLSCKAFTEEGQRAVTFTPVYPPFLAAPRLSGRELLEVPLSYKDGRYVMDPEQFEASLTGNEKVLLLCSPHNPVGRSFSRDELQAIADICMKHEIVICSDEIHCDLVLDTDKKHIPTATLSREIANNTITLMSPSKTYNIPGLNCGFAIIPNPMQRKPFVRHREGIVPYNNVLGYTACEAAYRDCDSWREELLDYLRGNRDLVEQVVREKMAPVKMDHVEATTLAWLDVRELKIENTGAFFENAGVGLFDGPHFHGDGFVRLNFGCPRETLEKGLERMVAAINSHVIA